MKPPPPTRIAVRNPSHDAHRKSARRPRQKGGDALALLAADHEQLGAMFERLHTARLGARGKARLVREICVAVRVHMMLEEEIFDPVARRAIGEGARMDEVQSQHDAIKPLLLQLVAMRPGDNHYDASIAVLDEFHRLHVEQEHEDVFPRVRSAGLNLRALGEQLQARKRVLESATVVLGEVLTTGL